MTTSPQDARTGVPRSGVAAPAGTVPGGQGGPAASTLSPAGAAGGKTSPPPTPPEEGAPSFSLLPACDLADARTPAPGRGEADPAAGDRLPASPGRGRAPEPGRDALEGARRVPAGSTYVRGGVTLTAAAHCIGRCGWTAGPGAAADVDRAADRHTTRPPKHPTAVVAEMAGAA